MHSWPVNALVFLSAGDPRPMYQQIVDQITARVMAGEWAAGQALPSIRELAASSGISVITVKRAYEELERAGLIHTRHGKGSVVAERPSLARELHERALRERLVEAVAAAARLGLDRPALHAALDAALDLTPSTPSAPDPGPTP
ncbi:MAG: GntR family transcriptional regulator [Lysobacteraceae bacterium]|jgi:GntR family transcriptional regulator